MESERMELREQIEREVRDSEAGVNMTDYEVSLMVDLILEHRAKEAERGVIYVFSDRTRHQMTLRARELRAMKGR